mmetsp:Transcript_81607/g.162377  ORF Transcript_81607/g.162377 Transcript_81607/m.162377 type:complete len:249 (-) Transcript_81607:44-790(-)
MTRQQRRKACRDTTGLKHLTQSEYRTRVDRGLQILEGTTVEDEEAYRVRANFSADVVTMRRKLRDYERNVGDHGVSTQGPGCLINPDTSVWLTRWDTAQVATLSYTSIVTPFEVAFLDIPTSPLNPWFLINRALDVIFVADMVLQFFVMYRAKLGETQPGFKVMPQDSRINQLPWVSSQRRIAMRYFRGWFTIDLLSVASSAFDIPPVLTHHQTSGLVSRLKSFRVIRILRLVYVSSICTCVCTCVCM